MRHPEMTDERIHGLMRKAVHGGLSTEEAADVTLELWRARRVEQEQAEQIRQKDEKILALVEASEKTLTTLKAWHKNKGEWWDCQRMLSAAIAQAGRKP